MPVNRLMHAAVHRNHDIQRDARSARSYQRLAGWTLRGLYRRVAADVAATAPSAATIVDVGTGPGYLLREIADIRSDVTLCGVDPAIDMIKLAARLVEPNDSERVRCEVGDVGALPQSASSVDVVVSTLSMHHWPDASAASGELARVLKPSGRLAIYDFRFAPIAEIIAAIEARDEFRSSGVARVPFRAGRWPVTPFARITASKTSG